MNTYNDQTGNDQGSLRKQDLRSRSRSRSRSRDRHRKHKRRRHRSRSRSRDKGWMSGSLGPSASALLTENDRLEREVQRLQNELVCAGARITPLENELRNCVVARNKAEQRVIAVNAEKRKLQFDYTELAKREFDKTELLKKKSEELDRIREQLEKKDRISEFERNGLNEQNTFLTQRNETLGRKCEELLEKSRNCEKQTEESFRMVASVRLEMEKLQTNMDMKLIEFRRMENEVLSAREKEMIWKVEGGELEKKLANLNALLSMSEIQKKRDKDHIELLEKKLKSSSPAWEAQLGLESLYRTMETLKQETTTQFILMKQSIEPLKDPLRRLPTSLVVPGSLQRPSRVHSAPGYIERSTWELSDVQQTSGGGAKSTYDPQALSLAPVMMGTPVPSTSTSTPGLPKTPTKPVTNMNVKAEPLDWHMKEDGELTASPRTAKSSSNGSSGSGLVSSIKFNGQTISRAEITGSIPQIKVKAEVASECGDDACSLVVAPSTSHPSIVSRSVQMQPIANTQITSDEFLDDPDGLLSLDNPSSNFDIPLMSAADEARLLGD